MKRIFSMLMAVTMLMCAVGFVPISAQAKEYTYGDTNEFEAKYNISDYDDDTPPVMEVIVPPPDVDTESGAVPYGTKVTISSAYGLRFRYSLNGEEFENPDASDAVITITEDTDLFVQSIVDNTEPNVSYLCYANTYMYTVDKTIIEISTAEELKAFADSVNNGNTYKGKTITLVNDIDLSSVCGAQMDETDMEVSWTPIGYDSPFNGIFDGSGHTVSGLYINSAYLDYAGLFGYCGRSSQILNLVVDGSVKVGYPTSGGGADSPIDIGGIAGICVGKIANCHNKAAITGLGNGAFAAGICGIGAVAIENCINTGIIVSEHKSEAIMALGSGNSSNNCYYLKDTSVNGSGAEAKTAEQFASGEVAYLLGEPWGQQIGVDAYPVIGGDKVYLTDNGYTNAPKKVVTIEPPAVSIESGEVPYGSKVMISPTNGNDFMYSVNGEQFINSRLTNTFGDAVITITEDTVLVVRSMIDVVEPDTEYVFPEVTYTYTIGGCVIPPEYPYMINSVKLVSEGGEEYDTPPADKSFIVDVDVTETVKRDNKDYFIVAAYDTDGELISMNYIKADLPANTSFSCGMNIPKTDKTIGSIKAFVWDSLGGMESLAENKILTFTAP